MARLCPRRSRLRRIADRRAYGHLGPVLTPRGVAQRVKRNDRSRRCAGRAGPPSLRNNKDHRGRSAMQFSHHEGTKMQKPARGGLSRLYGSIRKFRRSSPACRGGRDRLSRSGRSIEGSALPTSPLSYFSACPSKNISARSFLHPRVAAAPDCLKVSTTRIAS